ncbi:hypothetical protein [Levilactobacillus brevis]|uniref:hypothetical protein n=1 Tax=Levilactobacillus brevis TaxID=1580 RepID=UPI0021665B31|nr:hypothetical protein [Levilactobacillus brevis]MCT3565305.1 hypothetical protein [Levilactobacillus brevis]UVW18077.1 hypothetical protein NX820_09195 [Levilactobacillus brevis]
MSKIETVRAFKIDNSKFRDKDKNVRPDIFEQIQKKIKAKTFIGEKIKFNKNFEKAKQALPKSERELYYSWEKGGFVDSIQFDSPMGNLENIKYLSIKIKLEISKKDKYDEAKTSILPKSQRVESHDVQVIFLVISNELVVLIFSGNKLYCDRCKILIQKTISSTVINLSVNREIFTWLFFTYDQVEDRNVTDLVSVSEIDGFVGTISDEKDSILGLDPSQLSKVTSSSQKLSKLFVTQAFISLGNLFTGVQIELLIKKIERLSDSPISMEINVSKTGNVYDRVEMSFDEDETLKLKGSNSQITSYMTSETTLQTTVIYVYSLLLPLILSSFETQKTNFEDKILPEYEEILGSEVIRQILEKNPHLNSSKIIGIKSKTT